MNNIHRKPRVSSRHLGLETSSPAYSNKTIKRALITWFELGQQNEFQDVCNYYHHLQSMEEKLSAEERVSSRAAEFNLLSKPPPISDYLIENFPNLYHNYMTMQKRAKLKDLIETMTVYSKIHSKPLRMLLAEFQDFAKKTKTENSIENIAMYIQKLNWKDELTNWVFFPKKLRYLYKVKQYMDNLDISDTKTEDLRNGTIETLITNRTKEINMTPKNNENRNNVCVLC